MEIYKKLCSGSIILFIYLFINPCLLIKADWAKATGVYLSPYCRLPSLARKHAKRDDTRCPGRKTRSATMGPVRTTLFLDVGNEQAPSQCNNQPAEAPILPMYPENNPPIFCTCHVAATLTIKVMGKAKIDVIINSTLDK